MPDRPHAWLLTVAGRTLVDQWRADSARRHREAVAALDPTDRAPTAERDDTLALLFLCCHPTLPPPSQLALTLRAVGGLTTAEIAAVLLKAGQARTWEKPVPRRAEANKGAKPPIASKRRWLCQRGRWAEAPPPDVGDTSG